MIMNKKRSLDDTCDIFLSRRRVRSPLVSQRPASEFARYAPQDCPDSMASPCFLLPRPLDLPGLPPIAFDVPCKKPLPEPGSSGELQPKPVRMANGRHHVPRPRNPFILFRCDLVHQRKALPRSDLDDTNISRIAGDLWRDMSAAQKKPWIELAAREKARHATLYPDYKYAPAHNGPKGKKGKSDSASLEDRPPRQVSKMRTDSPSDKARTSSSRQAERPRPYPQPRRRSSCPPAGAVPVPSQLQLDRWAPNLASQDDMQRRPSRTVMYQSAADWLSLPPSDPVPLDSTYTFPDLNQGLEACPAQNFDFFEPTFPSDACNLDFSAQELADMERLAMGATFTDPFSLAGIPIDRDSLFAYPTSISPFDSGSPSSLSSGTL